jgi:hypothetical protein
MLFNVLCTLVACFASPAFCAPVILASSAFCPTVLLDILTLLVRYTQGTGTPLLSRSERETTKELCKRKHKQNKREARWCGIKGNASDLEVMAGKKKDEFFVTEGAG